MRITGSTEKDTLSVLRELEGPTKEAPRVDPHALLEELHLKQRLVKLLHEGGHLSTASTSIEQRISSAIEDLEGILGELEKPS